MAVNKYMNRIIAASDADLGEAEDERLPDEEVDAKLHDHTYGKRGGFVFLQPTLMFGFSNTWSTTSFIVFRNHWRSFDTIRMRLFGADS